MIHDHSAIETADALHNIERAIDLLRLSRIVEEVYGQQKFVLSRSELVDWLTSMAILELEENVLVALKCIDFESMRELRLNYRAMLESNSRSGDEKSTNGCGDG